MLRIFRLKKGSVESTKEFSLNAFKSKEFTWFDYVNPTDHDLKLVSELAKIPLIDLKEHHGANERPKVYDDKDFSLIVFASPIAKDHEIETGSISIFITKNKHVITLRRHELEPLSRVQNKLISKPSLLESHSVFVHFLLDEILSEFFHFLDVFDTDVDKVENEIFKKSESSHVSRVFKIKKSLIYFHKSLMANREVITAIEKEYLAAFSKQESRKFRDLYNDIIQLIDSGETLRDILTGIIDIYLSSVSNNLNAVMKRLTVIASYVLVPTLISGIYGMNFKFMPEIMWEHGYIFALGLMLFSIIAVRWYFKKEGWL
ncbi:magnesium/cobalt transporter CorA [Candidatus Woesearchaeota archaeon]|jgi:magnesium transporter|nr:magnesium/cobalt transporter CorA [Candidatus Woesearchaeota archaeon]MBT6519235.1 magnesium/cobalt transporter CorA [Candidatus Woesearchaeota archaeon]MBT7366780.1 magnesium/cobalt transporter CorA [Candidatus Woesearchaeota archaeon]